MMFIPQGTFSEISHWACHDVYSDGTFSDFSNPVCHDVYSAGTIIRHDRVQILIALTFNNTSFDL